MLGIVTKRRLVSTGGWRWFTSCHLFTGPLSSLGERAREGAAFSARGFERPGRFDVFLTCRFKIQACPPNPIQSRPQGVHVMMGRN